MSTTLSQTHSDPPRGPSGCTDGFIDDESGAVTTEWAVLTSAIVGLSIAVIASVALGIIDLGEEIGSSLAEDGMPTSEAQRDDDEAEPDDDEAEPDASRGTDGQRGRRPSPPASPPVSPPGLGGQSGDTDTGPQVFRGTDPQRASRPN